MNRLSTIQTIIFGILSLPAWIAGILRWIAVWIASERWYLWGFIPCNAGLWPLGLYCWHKNIERWYFRIPLRIFSYICFLFGTILFFAGLWPCSGILVFIRLLMWLDKRLRLGDPLVSETGLASTARFHHPLDMLCLFFIGAIFLVLAINKERLLDFGDPSDHFYHMAVAQKILERGTIPLWDDWEFAPMGRPHLYPPLLHLLIAFFAGQPDDILSGFSTIQMLLYPSTLLAYSLLFRTLLSPEHAFLSLLVLSMEFVFTLGCLMGLPASIVNLMWPFILMALLKQRTYLALFLLAAAFYTHTGMPVLVSLSLLVLGIWKREYLKRVIAIVTGAVLLASPWLVRYVAFSDWMQSGGAQGFSLSSIVARLLWLQIVNPLFLVLAVWGWFRLKPCPVFKSQAVGFLPMLTQYGGRYFMHGAPFLSPFVSIHFVRFLQGTVTRRRAVCFILATLIPLPCINFMGPNDSIQIHPFPGITAAHVSIFYTLNRQRKDRSETTLLIETIKKTTALDDIIHLPDEGNYHFGDFITVMTSRRTDTGGWGEVRKPEMVEAIQKSREDVYNGVFVSKHRENIPEGRFVKQIGSFFLGYPPPTNKNEDEIDFHKNQDISL